MSIPSITTTTTRRVVLGLSLLPVLILAACATANGPVFTQVEATPTGMAQLYLYRKSALYAMGATYGVTNGTTGQALGKLHNASYLVLPLNPGKHVISVAEGGFASDKTFEVQAEAGKNYFVEYDSSKGLLLGWGLLSGSTARTETQALADLKELRRAN